MDGARDQFFARAGLAENAHARFAGGNPLDLRNQLSDAAILQASLIVEIAAKLL